MLLNEGSKSVISVYVIGCLSVQTVSNSILQVYVNTAAHTSLCVTLILAVPLPFRMYIKHYKALCLTTLLT